MRQFVIFARLSVCLTHTTHTFRLFSSGTPYFMGSYYLQNSEGWSNFEMKREKSRSLEMKMQKICF